MPTRPRSGPRSGSRSRPRSRKPARSRHNTPFRIRLTAIIVTTTAAALIAVLAACPPARRVVPVPISAPPSTPPGPSTPPVQPDMQITTAPPAASLPTSPPARQDTYGKLAVIIDDAGYSLPELEPFLRLPGPLTVAVLPNLPHSTEAARRVLAAGKDLILHCPMEPEGSEDPGPGAIRTGMSAAEVEELLDRDFASVPGAAGMNNHMGSKATADPALMEIVLDYLKRHGKFFVDSRTTAETAGPRIALRLGIPFLQRNVFIDDERTHDEIDRFFETGVEEARTRGSAVVIGHVQTPAVVDILRARLESLSNQEVRLARLQEIMKEPAVAYSP